MTFDYIIDYFAAEAVGHVGVVPSEEVGAAGDGGDGDVLGIADLVLGYRSVWPA